MLQRPLAGRSMAPLVSKLVRKTAVRSEVRTKWGNLRTIYLASLPQHTYRIKSAAGESASEAP